MDLAAQRFDDVRWPRILLPQVEENYDANSKNAAYDVSYPSLRSCIDEIPK